MNWPKSIGWLKGPMSDGRKDRDSTALASLAITACHAPGIAMFTAAAARERRMSTVPTRAATARWRSVQSSWATAHPNSRPLAMTNVPVRKIAAGTWRTSALSTPQTRKPANHHCPGRLRSGRLPTIRRSGIVTAHSTTKPSSRYPTWGPARGARSGGRTAPPMPPARLWRGDWRTRTPAPPRRPAPPAPAAARPQPHPRERPLPVPTPTRRPDRVVPSGATDVPDRSPQAVAHPGGRRRPSLRPSSPSEHRHSRPRHRQASRSSDAVASPPASLGGGHGPCSTPTGREHTRPQVPVVPRLGE